MKDVVKRIRPERGWKSKGGDENNFYEVACCIEKVLSEMRVQSRGAFIPDSHIFHLTLPRHIKEVSNAFGTTINDFIRGKYPQCQILEWDLPMCQGEWMSKGYYIHSIHRIENSNALSKEKKNNS